MRTILAILAALLLLAGCGGGGGGDGDGEADEAPPVIEAPAPDTQVVTEFCDDLDVIRGDNAFELIYENNVWNKQDITDYEQCLLSRGEGEDAQYGWRWRWPSGAEMGREYEVKAFPNLFYGHQPWRDVSTSDAMPVRVGDVTEFDVAYNVSLDAEGTYNLAFQFFTTNGPEPTPETRVHEIMIWVAHNFDPQPAPYFVEEVEIDGDTWDLYVHENFIPSAVETFPIHYIAFAIQGERLAGTIDMAKFIDHLVQGGHVSQDVYLAYLALGNEVVHGTGTLWVNEFQVNLPGAAVAGPPALRGDVGVGSYFVSALELPSGAAVEVTYTAVERARHRGRAVYVVEESLGGQPTGNTHYFDVQTNNEAARLRDGEFIVEFVPHDGRVQYPLEVGRTYRNPNYSIRDDSEGDWWVEWEIEAQEEITVGAETYTAYRVAVVDTKDESPNDADVFWVADVAGVALTLKGDFYSAEVGGRIEFQVVEFELVAP